MRGMLLLLLATCFASVGQTSATTPARPNIVFFLVDDMGWQETSVPFHRERTELNRRYRTPNMEQLAAQGMKFTQAYASAVCSPTRVSALTGMTAARHRVTNWTLRRNRSPDDPRAVLQPPPWNVNGVTTLAGIEHALQVTPLPTLLREAGYRTIHVGKAHFGALETPGEDPRHLGFDINIAGHAAGGPGSHWGTKNFSAGWRTQPPDLIWDVPGLEAYHGRDIHLTEALTLEAIRAVEQAAADHQPFYLYLSHYAVHAPWEKDDRFHQAYLDAGLNPFEATLASMIEGMDKSLGDLMDALERLGVAENTIVLFMSDNGSPSQCPPNLPLRGHKLTPYEGGTRVPMLVKWPGVTAAGTSCDHPVIIEDVFPTLLEIAGVDWRGRTRQTVDGISFVPLLNGTGRTPPDRSFLWHFPHTYSGQGPFSAIRQGPWKLIHHPANRRLQLFNLEEDIGESEDLAAKYPGRLADLTQLLATRLQETRAQMPLDPATGEPVPLPAASAQLKVPRSAIVDRLEWKGVAIEEPDFTLWGASPILADGQVHLFAARWPEPNVDPAWRRSSEIAQYVAEHPEGPFRFRRVVLQGTGRSGDWDAYAPHNPEIQRFGDTFALCYIANSDFHQPPHPLNQRIGMVVADHIDGPWRKVGSDGLILGPSSDPRHFSHGRQVVNPALLQVGDRFHLYFKTTGPARGTTVYGLAMADQLTGPYRMLDEPLTSAGVTIEDGSAFSWDGKVCLLTTDNHGKVTGVRGAGVLWVSDDGIRFRPEWTQLGFDLIPRHFTAYDPGRVRRIYGEDPKLERPKILCIDGQPAWLYAPSGWNVTGGQRTVNHVLRIHLQPDDGPVVR
jgi:arylsulfatase A-like enzyme